MTRRSRPGGTRTPRDPASKRAHAWLRGLRRGRDMRERSNQAFVGRAAEIVATIGGEPNIAQLDVVERYCFVVAEIEKVEAAARDRDRRPGAPDGTAVDVSSLHSLSERLLRQAKALNALPAAPEPAASSGESALARAFAESFNGRGPEHAFWFDDAWETNDEYATALRAHLRLLLRDLAAIKRRDPTEKPRPVKGSERKPKAVPPTNAPALPAPEIPVAASDPIFPPDPKPLGPTGVLPRDAGLPPTVDVTPSVVNEAARRNHRRLDGLRSLRESLDEDLI